MYPIHIMIRLVLIFLQSLRTAYHLATSLWYPNSLNDILSAHLVEYLHSPGNHASLPLSRDKHDRGLKLFKAFLFIGPFKHNMILPYVIQVVIYVTT